MDDDASVNNNDERISETLNHIITNMQDNLRIKLIQIVKMIIIPVCKKMNFN